MLLSHQMEERVFGLLSDDVIKLVCLILNTCFPWRRHLPLPPPNPVLLKLLISVNCTQNPFKTMRKIFHSPHIQSLTKLAPLYLKLLNARSPLILVSCVNKGNCFPFFPVKTRYYLFVIFWI